MTSTTNPPPPAPNPQAVPHRSDGPVVITPELADVFLGRDHDKGLVGHVRRYPPAEFPALVRARRTTVTRQVADLDAVKKQLHAHPAERRAARDQVLLVVRLPIDARALSRARSRGEAACGHDRGLVVADALSAGRTADSVQFSVLLSCSAGRGASKLKQVDPSSRILRCFRCST